MKVSFFYREGISLFSKFEIWLRRRKRGYNYITPNKFPPPLPMTIRVNPKGHGGLNTVDIYSAAWWGVSYV